MAKNLEREEGNFNLKIAFLICHFNSVGVKPKFDTYIKELGFRKIFLNESV